MRFKDTRKEDLLVSKYYPKTLPFDIWWRNRHRFKQVLATIGQARMRRNSRQVGNFRLHVPAIFNTINNFIYHRLPISTSHTFIVLSIDPNTILVRLWPHLNCYSRDLGEGGLYMYRVEIFSGTEVIIKSPSNNKTGCRIAFDTVQGLQLC